MIDFFCNFLFPLLFQGSLFHTIKLFFSQPSSLIWPLTFSNLLFLHFILHTFLTYVVYVNPSMNFITCFNFFCSFPSFLAFSYCISSYFSCIHMLYHIWPILIYHGSGFLLHSFRFLSLAIVFQQEFRYYFIGYSMYYLHLQFFHKFFYPFLKPVWYIFIIQLHGPSYNQNHLGKSKKFE